MQSFEETVPLQADRAILPDGTAIDSVLYDLDVPEANAFARQMAVKALMADGMSREDAEQLLSPAAAA